jgi:hypothetical protein
MRKNLWILAVVGVLACGTIAAGCGSDDDSTSTTEVTVEDTDASTTTSGDDTTVTATDNTSSDSGGVDTEAFLKECNDAAAGTPGEATAATVCQQAADGLEKCADQAGDAGVEICQQVADQAVKQLQAAG